MLIGAFFESELNVIDDRFNLSDKNNSYYVNSDVN